MIIGGTRKAHATWIVKDGGTGASSATVYNAATGETITWNNALNASEWLRLKSDGQTAEVSSDSGSNWTSRPGGMSGIVPQVSGGSDNAVTVTGVGGTIKVNYTAVG
jgi:hypothetical protein